MMIETATRRVAIYTRVSSDDQAERGTIRVQAAEVRRRLEREPNAIVVGEYADDGVSGTVPLADRPAGARLLADARAGLIEEVHVYKLDRLGRDLIGLAIARQAFIDRGIRLISAVEGEPDEFMFDIQSAVAANERRVFLRRSADGMTEAARQGRYCGGIIAFGYRVEGRQATSRLVPDDAVMWADQSPADLVRWMYDRLALDGWSCRRIATELNGRGVPTHYARDARLVMRDNRKQRTQAVWRAGRIRNLVRNPVYRGEIRYGVHSAKRGREIICAPIEGLVTPAIWYAAQATLQANRSIAKNTPRRYLLKSVIRCGICGLTYCGSQGRGEVGWYRRTGQLVERGPVPGRCWGQSIRTDAIEPAVWADIERWLRDPGDVLDDLDGPAEREAPGAIIEVEAITLGRAIAALDAQRKAAIGLKIRGRLGDAELDAELDRIAAERSEIERRLAALQPVEELPEPQAIDLLAEIRGRLDEGLTIEQRQEIVRLLVHIVVHTTTGDDGKKAVRAVATYRFPAVVETRTGMGWSRRPAGIAGRVAAPDARTIDTRPSSRGWRSASRTSRENSVNSRPRASDSRRGCRGSSQPRGGPPVPAASSRRWPTRGSSCSAWRRGRGSRRRRLADVLRPDFAALRLPRQRLVFPPHRGTPSRRRGQGDPTGRRTGPGASVPSPATVAIDDAEDFVG